MFRLTRQLETIPGDGVISSAKGCLVGSGLLALFNTKKNDFVYPEWEQTKSFFGSMRIAPAEWGPVRSDISPASIGSMTLYFNKIALLLRFFRTLKANGAKFNPPGIVNDGRLARWSFFGHRESNFVTQSLVDRQGFRATGW